MDGLLNKPNNVLEKQKYYQTSPRPLYLRGPRSRLYMSVYLLGWTTGLIGVTAGALSLIKGKGKPSA